MANRRLTQKELMKAHRLLGNIRRDLVRYSAGDQELLFAYRRKIFKELIYDERDKPMVRRKLKQQKRQEQNGLCAECSEALPMTYCVLDRRIASAGYTAKNTELICQICDQKRQIARNYS